MHRNSVRLAVSCVVLAVAAGLSIVAPTARVGATTTTGSTCGVDCLAIETGGRALVARDDGPPGLIVLVDRRGVVATYSFGTSELGTSSPITASDHLRLASVSKAYSAALALAMAAKGTLHLSDPVGRRVHGLPKAWRSVTLAELLQHTSGIPDFIQAPQFRADLTANPYDPPSRFGLVSLAFPLEMSFSPPGSSYRYSNTDNELVGLMVQSAAGRSYEHELATLVTNPLGLADTSLPQGEDLAVPYAHGYSVEAGTPPKDVTNEFSAGWSWASGGMVATPSDVDRFMRADASGTLTTGELHAQQLHVRPGSSEPPGPGTNEAGLGIFRYETRCGTVYGHTGNTLGYTQFAASTSDGTRSVVVQANAQITPGNAPEAFARLLEVETSAVCASLSN